MRMFNSDSKLMKLVLRIAGKETLELDTNIPTSYLLALAWRYGVAMIRGFVRRIGFSSAGKTIFIGGRVKFRCKNKIRIGSKARLKQGVYIDALSRNGVSIGNNCVLGQRTRIECTGSLSFVGEGLRIGDSTSFGADCFFGAAGGICIGRDVIAGQLVRFHSENHIFADKDEVIRNQGVSHLGITIGNNVWIGAGAVFLDGANISDGCVIAANAVVTKGYYPENTIIGGVPARIIGQR